MSTNRSLSFSPSAVVQKAADQLATMTLAPGKIKTAEAFFTLLGQATHQEVYLSLIYQAAPELIYSLASLANRTELGSERNTATQGAIDVLAFLLALADWGSDSLIERIIPMIIPGNRDANRGELAEFLEKIRKTAANTVNHLFDINGKLFPLGLLDNEMLVRMVIHHVAQRRPQSYTMKSEMVECIFAGYWQKWQNQPETHVDIIGAFEWADLIHRLMSQKFKVLIPATVEYVKTITDPGPVKTACTNWNPDDPMELWYLLSSLDSADTIDLCDQRPAYGLLLFMIPACHARPKP